MPGHYIALFNLKHLFWDMLIQTIINYRCKLAIADNAGQNVCMSIVRKETPADTSRIHHLNAIAFGQADEAQIVDNLRKSDALSVSLVAEENKQIIGHIAFSPVCIERQPEKINILGLGPMAVLPAYQNKGIGAQLIEQGLALCKEANCDLVVVLGHPNYYPRFGFVPTQPFGILCEYDVPADVFMLQELKKGVVSKLTGTIKYHAAFANA